VAKSEDWELINTMYAIVRAVGRQYRAEPGRTIDVEKMNAEPGAQITISDVLLIVPDGGTPIVGRPTVAGATVTATVLEHYRDKKIFVWKYYPGRKFRKRRGHRQTYTRLQIDGIQQA
jgi:large subunit ribosomal protein L21